MDRGISPCFSLVAHARGYARRVEYHAELTIEKIAFNCSNPIDAP